VRKGRWIVLGIAAAGLAGLAVIEHTHRRFVQRQLAEAILARQQLEQRVADVLATHERLKRDIEEEQQHSRELTDALATVRKELEDTTGRLADEIQHARRLQTRLAAMQGQLDQLQGELVTVLQKRQGSGAAAGGAAPVQLERIVVSDAASDLTGRIISVHHEWDFVVINLGWDTVRIGDTVSIVRNGQLQAKARVDRVQEGMCAATVLPEWQTDAIRVNDVVRLL
jgi:DNA repair exonuclease SbcCD ATPase subunit